MKKIDYRAAVYGTVSIGALLAAESVHEETYAATISGVGITLLIYVLIHAYSDYTGERLSNGEPLELGGLASTIASEGWLVVGAGIPLVALLICWALDASLSTAVTVAIWTSAAMVLILEVAAGVRAGESGRELGLQAAAGAVFGLLVIGLRIVLH